MKAPKKIGAAAQRDADNGPFDFDHAGELINSQYSKNGPDNQGGETVSLEFLRRRFVRRAIHCGPELEAFIVAMAFSEGAK